jgi:hypothetical protein
MNKIVDQACIVLTLTADNVIHARTLDGNDADLNAMAEDLAKLLQACLQWDGAWKQHPQEPAEPGET